MKARNTVILLLIAAGMYFFMRYYESKQLTTQESEEANTHVVQLDRDKVSGITITNNEAKIELRLRGGEWQMDAPAKDKADDTAVGQLINAIDALHKDTSITPEAGKDDVRDLGLTKPNIQLQLLGDGAPPPILFGKDTAIEGKEYIRLGNSNTVYIVSNDLRTQVSKTADSFRDHQLSIVPSAQVNLVNIKTPQGEIELQKDHDHWQINRPIKARGDDGRVADVIAQTLNTKIDSFLPADNSATANTTLNDPQGTVTFTAEGTDKPLVLQISKTIDGGKVYAKLSTRDSVFVLPTSVGAILGTKPNDVRDHHLIRLNLDTVDRIHIAPAGAPEILLARKGEAWTIKSLADKPANGGDVQSMAAALQNQLVTSFVSDVATDLPKYGLDQPRLKVQFSSYATENTAETKAGEQPLETILFGKANGDNVYAKLDDEPFIVSVPKAALDAIYTDPLKWQELAIYNLKPGDITAIDFTKDSQATLSVIKDKGQWKPAKGDIALNTANITSMASTLATLRAVRWAGATRPDQGLDKPAATIKFTTADKKSYTVTIGAASGDYWNATTDGQNGTFLLTKTDHDTLTADLLPEAKPAATPAIPVVPNTSPSSADAQPAPANSAEVTTSPVEAK